MSTTLSIFEQYELNLVGEAAVRKFMDALINKEIRRRSRKPGVGIFYATAKASGELAASVRSESLESGIAVTVLAYVENVLYGSKPGTMVNPADIEKWMVEKGLKFNPRTIAEQIYRYGSSIWQEHEGKNSGVFDDVNLDQELKRLTEALAKNYVSKVADDFFNILEAA